MSGVPALGRSFQKIAELSVVIKDVCVRMRIGRVPVQLSKDCFARLEDCGSQSQVLVGPVRPDISDGKLFDIELLGNLKDRRQSLVVGGVQNIVNADAQLVAGEFAELSDIADDLIKKKLIVVRLQFLVF